MIGGILVGLAATTAFQGRGASRFFLDTADRSEYAKLLPLGIFHGVTTNPTLLQRAGVPCTVEAVHNLAAAAFELGAKEFMCQGWGGTVEGFYETGMALRDNDDRIVVKVPVTAAGVEAAAMLQAQDVRICLTACYASTQALVAASLGAEYIAPYLGRMDDAGRDGLAECKRMHDIARGLGSETRIFVASIRDVESMAELAAHSLDSFTFSPAIARELFTEALTEEAAAVFEGAALVGQEA